MKHDTLLSFEKVLSERPSFMTLILAPDDGERQNGYEVALRYAHNAIFFSHENFSVEAFLQEVETVPFLSKQKTLVIRDIDQIEKNIFNLIQPFLLAPTSWCSFILTASSLPAQSKLLIFAEQKGILYCLSEEKPWEKEKRLAKWVAYEAKKQGVSLSMDVAQLLVQLVDHAQLKHELDKLMTYVGNKGVIEKEDVEAISFSHSQGTIWQLIDAVLEKRGDEALKVAKKLYDAGDELLPIIAQLRTQMNTAQRALYIFQNEGKESVTKAFPYLRGGLLEKKLKLFQTYGHSALRDALLTLFETELIAKNSSQDPELLLEIMLFKLTHDTFSSPQFARRS